VQVAHTRVVDAALLFRPAGSQMLISLQDLADVVFPTRGLISARPGRCFVLFILCYFILF